jgi:hypothetical protein
MYRALRRIYVVRKQTGIHHRKCVIGIGKCLLVGTGLCKPGIKSFVFCIIQAAVNHPRNPVGGTKINAFLRLLRLIHVTDPRPKIAVSFGP